MVPKAPVVATSVAGAAVATAAAPLPLRRVETADLAAPKTSPTLVGFQSKNATLPDWRLQLQNAVQLRKGVRTDAISTQQASADLQFPVNGSAALKPEAVRRIETTIAEPAISDPRVANAMRRINDSRKTFFEAEKKMPLQTAAPVKPYKFDVVASNASPLPSPTRTNVGLKPRLVSPAPPKRDTNKLPPIPVENEMVDRLDPLDNSLIAESVADALPVAFAEINRIQIRAEHQAADDVWETENTEDIEDLAQFSTRFGAGLFDFIIASFASLLILSPVAFTRGEWFTPAGLLTFAGVCAIVMFIYMTVCLGFWGKTMGMRLFSLELVDAVENEYPTLHQAAVSSSLFIFSLIFGGAGFLTIFFNEEKRAAHDLLSGTILVREF